jgi:WD40 repeat protein
VILATEAGVIVMTDLGSELQVPQDSSEVFFDPVVSVHALHQGAITALALSAYDDNILATAGQDLKLHLVAVMSPHSPALSYQLASPASSLAWSPSRPCLLAAATDRAVLLFDVVQSRSGPVLSVAASERRVRLPLTTVAFPARDGGRLAAGDAFGRVCVWRLPDRLNTATIHEKNVFQNLPYGTV